MKRLFTVIFLLLFGGSAWANSTLQNMAANTALNLGAYACTDVAGETGNCKRVTDYSGAAYDSVTKKFYVFGGGHASTNYDAINAFNTETTTWNELYAPTSSCSVFTGGNWNSAQGSWTSGSLAPYPRPQARHSLSTVHVVNGEVIMTSAVEGNQSGCGIGDVYAFATGTAKAAHYNLAAGTWSFSAAATDSGNIFPASAYDPVSGNIVIVGRPWLDLYNPVTKVRTRQINLLTTSWLKNEGGSNLDNADFSYNNSMVYYPPNDRFYYMAKGYGVIEIVPNRSNWALSTATLLNTTGTQSPGNNVGGTGIAGYAYDSVAQIIGTIAGGKFYAFNPTTKAFSNQTISGFSGDVGDWAIDYDSFNNVWIFIQDWRTASRTYAYKYQSGGGSGGSDFATRCAAAVSAGGRCAAFDDSAEIANTAWGGNTGLYLEYNNGKPPPVIDTSVKASGAGSLKFTISSQSPANGAGIFWMNFSTDLSKRFGAGESFYLQWRQRFSPEMLSTNYLEPGGSPTNGWKTSIISTGDRPGGCTASDVTDAWCQNIGGNGAYISCTPIDMPTQNIAQRGWIQVYNSCLGSTSHPAPYSQILRNTASPTGPIILTGCNPDCQFQDRPSPYCLYSQQGQANGGGLPPNGNCFGFFANEWMTFKIKITLGARGTGTTVGASPNDEWVNSRFELWIGREGQSMQRVMDFGPFPASAGKVSGDQKFGKIWIGPYITGKDSAQVHATAFTWYDELIFSPEDIADPGGSPVVPPSRPTAIKVTGM